MSAVILCIQDDREIGRVYADALAAEGYEVLAVHDGRGALEFLRRQSPVLVLLDTYLPRLDGFEVLAEIRSRTDSRELPVLLLSEGDLTDEILDRAQRLGADGIESAPIETDRLIARVAEIAGPAEGKAEAQGPVFRDGNFREVPLPELLRSLHVEGLDGVLLLDHGRKKKAIELRGGWPVSIKSNLISECFGNYLVEQGRCTQSDLDESVQRMKSGEGLQGEILIAMEVLDEEEVTRVLREHALEKFFELFSWRDGNFQVRPRAHVGRGSSFGIDGHPSKLILEGIRRRYPLRQIDRYLEMHQSEFLVPLPYDSDQLGEFELREEEAHWLCQLDGRETVGTFLQYPDVIRRIAFALISIEVLGVLPDPGSGPVGHGAGAADSESSGRTSRAARTDEELRVELANLANRIREVDHYQTLGVAFSASDEAIRSAYTRLAKNTHPDRFHGASSSVRLLASQVFDRICQAHSAIATVEARHAYAEELDRGRRVFAAEAEGRRALEAETEYQRGEQMVAKRDYEGALLSFGRAMQNFPSEGEYHSNYGWCLYLCHPDSEVMLGEALEHCRKGVKLAKDREKPYLLLGRLYKVMGRVGPAKKMFTRAVEIQPQCVEAMRELRIMNMRRDKDKGVLKRIFRR